MTQVESLTHVITTLVHGQFVSKLQTIIVMGIPVLYATVEKPGLIRN